MKKDIIISKEYVVIWFTGTTDISLETKKDFEIKLNDYGYYQHDNYQYEEFDTFEEADKFVDELWEEVK